MLREARKKIATSVSKIEVQDEFQFNKWLRPPITEKFEIKKVRVYEDGQSFPIEKLKQPLTVKLKFSLPTYSLIDIKPNLELDSAKSYMVFFSVPKQNIIDLSDVYTFKEEPEIEYIMKALKSTVEDKSKIFIVSVPQIFLKEESISIPQLKELPLLIRQPDVVDYLSKMIPEIIKIDLLDSENLTIDLEEGINYHSFDIDRIKAPKVYKIKVPGIENLYNTTTTTSSVPLFDIEATKVLDYKVAIDSIPKISRAKFEINKATIIKPQFYQYDHKPEVVDVLKAPANDVFSPEAVKQILSPIIDLKWEDATDILSFLSNSEKDGAQFLTDNNYSILSDELGIDKFNQVTGALKYLHKVGKVSSVLILSSNQKFKAEESSINLFGENWKKSVSSYAREMKFTDAENPSGDIFKQPFVFLDVNELIKIGSEGIENFRKFDCVILDEILNLTNSAELVDNLIYKTEPDYLWIVSDFAEEEQCEKVVSEFSFSSKASFKFYSRKLDDVFKEKEKVIKKEIWLDCDEMQAFEYSEAVTAGREELAKTLETMNPFRFQSNIFTLIHKLKQIINFSAFRNISPKVNLLTDQMTVISKNRRKALIFSQYDENGIKKIENIFDNNDIKYISVKNGSSIEELKKGLKKFYEKKEISAFITNLKPSKLNINIEKVDYIINFDQWWNPVMIWQTEEELGINSKSNGPLVIYNYFMRSSFEQSLHELMYKKGLLEKELFELVKSESFSELISSSEWMKIFGYKSDEFIDSEDDVKQLVSFLEQCGLDKFKDAVSLILATVGYREAELLDIKDEPAFYMVGSTKKGTRKYDLQAKCIMGEKVTPQDYQELLEPNETEKILKRFVITNGTIEKIDNPIVTYVDKYQLANYIQMLGYAYKFLSKRTAVN